MLPQAFGATLLLERVNDEIDAGARWPATARGVVAARRQTHQAAQSTRCSACVRWDWARRANSPTRDSRTNPALADFGAQPGFVVIDALLRAEALERLAVPHEAELAVAVGATVGHGFLSGSRLGDLGRGFCRVARMMHRSISYCNAQLV
jgi:hypothetical protein